MGKPRDLPDVTALKLIEAEAEYEELDLRLRVEPHAPWGPVARKRLHRISIRIKRLRDPAVRRTEHRKELQARQAREASWGREITIPVISQAGRCPRCGSRLLQDNDGYGCLLCGYHSYELVRA